MHMATYPTDHSLYVPSFAAHQALNLARRDCISKCNWSIPRVHNSGPNVAGQAFCAGRFSAITDIGLGKAGAEPFAGD